MRIVPWSFVFAVSRGSQRKLFRVGVVVGKGKGVEGSGEGEVDGCRVRGEAGSLGYDFCSLIVCAEGGRGAGVGGGGGP